MEDMYTEWNKTATELASSDKNDWKTSRNVHAMLEHVPGKYALVYVDMIRKEGLTDAQIQAYADLCDSLGTPSRCFFVEVGLSFSPTCIRYLYHATQILKIASKLPIVELGAGYGGLVVAIDYVSKLWNTKVTSYSIIDLPGPCLLQQRYLKNFSLSFPVFWPSVHSIGSCFLVSNYALSEINEENRKKYIDTLFPKVLGGFMVWNSSASTDFLNRYSFLSEPEYPMTGNNNRVIRFHSL
jgi:hypothetical protein